ncbi:HalOD1 output domain-containing protein [Haloarcula onubensis]|uniref:Halobacterial output domain-containing protein n=1 Tax=Haloarcula onubensis TaxID=2950539 RepID=A0ABU2FMW1_9EURY|nr:HalOD1 output domain-containing protein [Halomicroarcula sp. S3CR25-11]MDS0282100.1 hypothetical protein [Halomicroarcula sp. S3CR25-11]
MSKTSVNSDSDVPPESGRTVRRTFDWSAVSPSAAVAEVIAETGDVEPSEVGPLYDVIDSDALDSLVRHRDESADCVVTFPYAGMEVSVAGEGEVLVTVPESRS